ncbi:hypothetical protein [Vibrio algivorus]|nr:hypothetical protein [Vibrio algivorus]
MRESETTNPYYRIVEQFPLNVTNGALNKIETDIHYRLTKKYSRIKHSSSGKIQSGSLAAQKKLKWLFKTI